MQRFLCRYSPIWRICQAKDRKLHFKIMSPLNSATLFENLAAQAEPVRKYHGIAVFPIDYKLPEIKVALFPKRPMYQFIKTK